MGMDRLEVPHSLQDLAEAASPLPKTPKNAPRGRNSHEPEQLRTKPRVSSCAAHLWAFLEEMGCPQVLHNLCMNGSFSLHKHILEGVFGLRFCARPSPRTPLFTCLNRA